MVLKRKAGTYNISNQRSVLGFSLNNPRRIGAHTGQPQTQTPYRGNAARGHGGNMQLKPPTNSQYICADSFNISHVSVKNNQGLLSTKKWLKRGYPYTVVKNCTPPSYELHLNKIKGHVAKGNTSNVNNGSCAKGYQKTILSMNYGIYYNSNIFVKNCIPLPPNKAHYPPQNIKSSNLCTPSLSLDQFIIKNEIDIENGNKC